MNRASLKARLLKGEKEKVQVIKEFKAQGHPLTLDSIARDIKEAKVPASTVFEKFKEVTSFTFPQDQEPTRESMQGLRDSLKHLLPSNVVDASDSFTKAIPAYLDSENVDADALVRQCWQALRGADLDEETIGIGWGAFLYLSD